MATDEDVRKELRRYERVEWLYDFLGGKIIPWTKEHGGHSDDPSVQAFVLKGDGTVLARAPDGQVHQASSFARWIREQADDYEKTYPPTRVPLVRTEVERREDDEGVVLVCADLDRARQDGKPVLLYLGREEREGQPRTLRREVKLSRKFERSTLDSKKAAEAAKGWVLLRLDLGDELAATYARDLGVEKAPALVIFGPGAAEPEILPSRTTGASLAWKLKKLRQSG